MKFHILLCISAISAFATGCAHSPRQPDDYRWEGKTTRLDTRIVPADSALFRTGGMEIMDNGILMYNVSQPDNFSYYILRNDSLIFSAPVQKKGKGPYEAIFSRAIRLEDCDKLYLIDQQSNEKAYGIDLGEPDGMTDVKTWSTLSLPTTDPLFSIVPTGCDDTFMAQILNDKEHMFGYFKAGDSVVTPIAFPYPDAGVACPEITLGTAFIGTLQKRPEYNEYVFSAQNSRYVMIFSLQDSIPGNVKLLYDAVPQFALAADGINPRISGETLSGFYVQATREYIYLTPRNHRDKDAEALEGHPSFGTAFEILVFDWNGEPVKRILLDRPVKNVTVDSWNDYMYARHTDSTSWEDHIVRVKL